MYYCFHESQDMYKKGSWMGKSTLSRYNNVLLNDTFMSSGRYQASRSTSGKHFARNQFFLTSVYMT